MTNLKFNVALKSSMTNLRVISLNDYDYSARNEVVNYLYDCLV